MNTILSCSKFYQKVSTNITCTIKVIDNHSTDETLCRVRESLYPIELYTPPFKSKSPVKAINWVVANKCTSDYVLICIDGARILSDQIVSQSQKVLQTLPHAFIYTLGYHIGPKTHMALAKDGYSVEMARQFLNALDWKTNPKELIDNSVLAGSSKNGPWQPIAESNAFVVRRDDWNRLGGYCEEFVSPGGGLANLELFQRFTQDSKLINVCLLDEGTFHQYHNGIATSGISSWSIMNAEYKRIFGQKFKIKDFERFYYKGYTHP